MKRRLLAMAMLLSLVGTAQAFDDPYLGLFCQGNCNYVGQLTFNDPAGITTTSMSATATGNLGGNSGNISGSMFTQVGGTCFYSRDNDPGCTSIIYPFPPAANGGCAAFGPPFHFCYQGAGTTCQESFSGSWNANSTNQGAYFFSHMQSTVGVTLNVNGHCPSGRASSFELDLDSVPYSDCDGKQGPNGLPIPPFYCNENYVPASTAEENGHPITGSVNRSDSPDD